MYVPALSIERSADAGVVVRFRDRRQSTYGDYAYDSGTETRLSESEGFLTWPADERVNGFGAFVLMTGLQYPCVLMLSLEVVPASGDGAGASIVLTDLTGHNNPTGCLYDTAPAMAAAE